MGFGNSHEGVRTPCKGFVLLRGPPRGGFVSSARVRIPARRFVSPARGFRILREVRTPARGSCRLRRERSTSSLLGRAIPHSSPRRRRRRSGLPSSTYAARHSGRAECQTVLGRLVRRIHWADMPMGLITWDADDVLAAMERWRPNSSIGRKTMRTRCTPTLHEAFPKAMIHRQYYMAKTCADIYVDFGDGCKKVVVELKADLNDRGEFHRLFGQMFEYTSVWRADSILYCGRVGAPAGKASGIHRPAQQRAPPARLVQRWTSPRRDSLNSALATAKLIVMEEPGPSMRPTKRRGGGWFSRWSSPVCSPVAKALRHPRVMEREVRTSRSDSSPLKSLRR